ncbi:hypothetical protein MSAN_01213600 [Mycena sanguinolenta]|uniref:NodB homology domain-containing protein n=1 Tax=Mycena sanguinolenta TaxID=230812 RepID=A0A8H6YI68_9AGAR|nr:hypothetical protein MSAN_01213600 [Mycena sanguinolenta]
MGVPLILSALLAASAVQARSLGYRATPQVYDSCINSNDIALTFDDGPYIYLRSISDQFTAAGAKATFFFNGNNWDCIYNSDRISDVQYAYAAGHMIGSHTWSHGDLTTFSTAQIQDGMYRMEEALSRIIGVKPAFMRPPIRRLQRQRAVDRSCARPKPGAVTPMATQSRNPEAVYNDVANSNVKNALILEHETEETTATTLVPYAIKLFQSKGYNLVTMAECLGVDPYQAIGVPQEQTSAWTCDGTPDPGAGCGGSIACETGTPVFSSAPSGPTSTPTANQYFSPSASSSKCLTASSNADGAAVEIQDCVSAGSTSQSWTVSGQSIQIFGDKCLDVTGGAETDGTLMQIWTCTDSDSNQQWSMSGNTIQWAGTSDCLDLTNGDVTDGNIMQIWSCTGGSNQQWTRTTGPPGGGTTTTTTPPPTATGTYIHPTADSTKCLTAASNADGAAVEIEDCVSAGSTSQAWTYTNENLQIFGNKCLDVTNGNTASGTPMQIWTCTAGDTNQEWTLAGNTIQWSGTSNCLDLTNGATTDGNIMQIWSCTNGPNQAWTQTSTP